jgi:hypothetical protein
VGLGQVPTPCCAKVELADPALRVEIIVTPPAERQYREPSHE